MNDQETYDERTIQLNALWQKMLSHWGERCDEFEQDCCACHAWAHFDKKGEILE